MRFASEEAFWAGWKAALHSRKMELGRSAGKSVNREMRGKRFSRTGGAEAVCVTAG